MIGYKTFTEKVKLFSNLTAQRTSPEMITALYERFKYSDQGIVLQAIESMIHDDAKMSFAALKSRVKAKINADKEKSPPGINLESWPDIQRQRMKALTEAVGQGIAAVHTLQAAQASGEGIWAFTAEKQADRYDCHENCDKGIVFYQDKDGNSYAGTCAICKKGPGKPSPLINPDNLQIIKQGHQRQGG